MSAELNKLSEEAQSLARIPLFKRLEPHELEHLAEDVDQVNYKAGETIFNEHDLGDGLYVVETGSVRIWVMDEDVHEVTLAELKPGDFFGELAVLDRGERSSSATALTDTHLHKLSSDAFQQFLIEHPDAAVDVICEIAQRMRQTNLLVSKRAARNINLEMEENSTIGQRIADKVASFGGSWTFIMIYVEFSGPAWIGVQYIRAGLLRSWRRRRPVRSLPVYPLEPDAFNDGRSAGADHHDVAEPRGQKGSACC